MQTTTSTPAPYRLRLLGKPALLDPQGRPTGTVAGKSIAILCYLVLRGGASRDELLALLWGDMEESRARNACRQALHRLRQSAPGMLASEGDLLRIVPGSVIVDVVAFQAAVDSQEFEQAAHIYTGDLFDSPDVNESTFLHWCDSERLRLRSAYHGILVHLAEEALLSRKTDAGLRWARAYRASAPAEATGALLESKVLAAAGRRTEAAAVLAEYAEQLKRDYDLTEPALVTEARKRLNGNMPLDRVSSEAAPSFAAEGFVGRERELGLLITEWRACRGGDGRLVVLTGRAGIGKTRLVREFVARAVDGGSALCAWGTETSHDGSLPYSGIAQALRTMLRAPGIGGASEHLLAEAARLLPELRDRFRLPTAPVISDETARLRLYEGVAALIDAVAYEQPVCIVIDHAERGTSQNFDMLRYLQVRLAGSPVLFILLADETPDEWSKRAGLVDGAAARVVELSLLPREELAAIGALVGLTALSEAESDRLIALAEGSPGRLIELIRRHAEGGSVVSPLVEASAIFSSRLAAMSGAEKRLFAAAALIGSGVPIRTLAAAAHLPEPAALAATLALKEVGLLSECGAGYEVPCSNPVNIAVQVLGEASVVLIAGWSAEAIEYQRYGSHTELAWLYKYAGRPADAFRTLRQAADDALMIGAVDDARKILEDAIGLAADRQQRAGVELLLRALRRQSVKQLARGPGELSRRIPRNLQIAAAVGGLVLLVAAFVTLQRPQARNGGVVLQDTLLLNSDGDDRFANLSVAGRLEAATLASTPSLPRLPWVNALPDARSGAVAIERITPVGTDVYLIRAARDTVPFVIGGGDDFVLGWSPDGEWVLVARSTGSAADYDTHLVAYNAQDRSRSFVIDDTEERRVIEAAWSPNGSHIAWVAETAAGRAVYLSRANGAGTRRLSIAGANDYHIAWSPDGARLGFTTMRFGNPEIAAYVLATNKLWRLTYNEGMDDHVRFSPDGRYAAFESDWNGERAVFVARSWGGRPTKVAHTDAQTAIVGWRGRALSYVATVEMEEIQSDARYKIIQAVIRDANGAIVDGALPVSFELVEGSSAQLETTENPRIVRVASEPGRVVQLIANIGGWRSDTSHIVFEAGDGRAFTDDFSLLRPHWLVLGRPRPRVADGAAVLRSEQTREAGLLSLQTLPIRGEMTLNGTIERVALPATGRATLALVAPASQAIYDEEAPQFLRLISVQILAGGSRIAYSVNREIQTQVLADIAPPGAPLGLTIRVLQDRTVEFTVNGQKRWHSTARLQDDYGGAQLWLGAAAAASVRFDDVSVAYDR